MLRWITLVLRPDVLNTLVSDERCLSAPDVTLSLVFWPKLLEIQYLDVIADCQKIQFFCPLVCEKKFVSHLTLITVK